MRAHGTLGLIVLLATQAISAQVVSRRSSVPVFGSATLVATGFSRMEALLDGNLDGKMDAVGVWYGLTKTTGRARFFANDGNGQMIESDLIQGMPFAAGNPQQNIVLGDWNGDGNRDFAINWLDGQFTFFHARSGGPFKDQTITLTMPGTIVAAAGVELDGDGDEDLAVLTTTGVHLFLNRGGRPSVAAGAFALSPTTTGELLVADLDGDQAPDLAIADHATARSIHLLKVHRAPGWNGPRPGALTSMASFSIPGTDAMHTAAGDCDGDGDDDVVVFRASGTYQVFAQTTPGVFLARNWSTGGPATALADIDGDGDLDGICCGGGGGGPGPNSGASKFEVSLNDGGVFAPAVAYPNLGAKRIAGAADMNGDGEVDLVAGRGILFHFDGLGARTTWITTPTTTAFDAIAPAQDVDGDGDLDLLPAGGALGIYANRGDGHLSARASGLPTAPPGITFELYERTWGDWNGDGLRDVLVGSRDANTRAYLGLRLFLSVDGFRFEDAGPIAPAADNLRVRVNGTPTEFVVDLDGDGDDDFVSTQGLSTRAMRNNGDGTFTELPWPSDIPPHEFRDLNGDGRPEVMRINSWLRHGSGGVAVFAGQASGLPGARTDYISQVTFFAARVVDADGDGDLDVFGRWPTTRLTYHENKGGNQFDMKILTERMSGPLVVHDLDGNGYHDVVFATTISERVVHLYMADGPGEFSIQSQVLPPTSNSTSLTFADLDGDGDVDVQGFDFLAGVAHHGDGAGRAVQFGAPRTGARNDLPQLGVQGPLRPGSTATLRLRSGSPQSLAILAAGIQSLDLPDFPWPQVNTYLVPLAQVVAPLDAQGRFALRSVITPGIANSRIVFQAFVLDPTAAAGLVSTNGVEVSVGR